jgi:hypothetical protein
MIRKKNQQVVSGDEVLCAGVVKEVFKSGKSTKVVIQLTGSPDSVLITTLKLFSKTMLRIPKELPLAEVLKKNKN